MTYFTKLIKAFVLVMLFTNLSVAQVYVNDFEDGTVGDLQFTVPDLFQVGDAAAASSGFWSVLPHTQFLYYNDDAAGDMADPANTIIYSAPIDLTGLSVAYAGYEAYWNDQDYYGDEQAKFWVSTDNGDNFTELLNMEANEFWQIVSVDLSAYVDQEILIAISYDDAGGWETGLAIDDIQITSENPAPPLDLQANDWFSKSTNFITPLDQVEPILFMLDIENIGSQDQYDVIINADIENVATMTDVFTASFTLDTLQADSTFENYVFAESFGPTETGSYITTYEVTNQTGEDFDFANNVREYPFIVSDTTFAKELQVEGVHGAVTLNIGGSLPNDGSTPRQYSAGNFFRIVNANGQYFRYATTAFNATPGSAGQTFTVSLYKWDDANADGTVQVDERELVGIAFHTISGDETIANPLTFEIKSLEDEPVALEDNTTYLLQNEYRTTTVDESGDIAMGFANIGSLFQYASWFAHDQLGDARWYSVLTLEHPAGIDASDWNAFTGNGFTWPPLLRMSIGEEIIMSSVNEELSADNKVNLFPMPAVDFTTLSLNFASEMKDVTIQFTNQEGKLLETRKLQNVTQQDVRFETTQYANGVYYLTVNTEAGSRTKMLIIQD